MKEIEYANRVAKEISVATKQYRFFIFLISAAVKVVAEILTLLIYVS